MSATVVDIRDPLLAVRDTIERLHELWVDIPTRDASREGIDAQDDECEGLGPDGYRYAPGSEEQIRRAAQLLREAVLLLQEVRIREWHRCGNGLSGATPWAEVQS